LLPSNAPESSETKLMPISSAPLTDLLPVKCVVR
jgi:hypothetical protein